MSRSKVYCEFDRNVEGDLFRSGFAYTQIGASFCQEQAQLFEELA